MSKRIKLDVIHVSYEELCCSVCSGYLSLAPIRLLPDGKALCCHCVPPNNVVPYRALFVENFLSEALFPCRYKQFGCSANVQFNKVLKHEEGCIHRPFPCASLPYTNCSWKGSVSQVTGHFAEKHSNFVQQEAKIKLCVERDKEGVLLVKENLKSFIVKYAFNSTMSSLTYRINLCMMDVDDQNCKLQLFNDLDLDYCLTLKAKCFAYNTYLCNDNLLNVDVKSILAALNNPRNITVVFHVKLPTPPADSSPNNEAAYKLFYSIRCTRCHHFLVPPLFDLQNKIICADCCHVKDCKRTTNKTLENLLNQKNFACKWRGCDFIGKGDIIGRHQSECDFRMYQCMPSLYDNCRTPFRRCHHSDHMKKYHSNYSYISEKYRYWIPKKGEKYFYAFKDNEIILIYMESDYVTKFDELPDDKDRLFYFRFENENKVVGTVYFSHRHCKCLSKTFYFSSSLSISYSKLPKCFKNYRLLQATINIKNY